MDRLDPVLQRLRHQPVDARLDGIGARIFSRIEILRERRRARATMGCLAICALTIGFTGGMTDIAAPRPRTDASPLTLIAGPPPLAPSTLLTGGMPS